jgi:uncharacterized protein (UPF0332 family)
MQNKLSWCKNQKKGIELIDPNDNLSQAYFLDADDSLDVMKNSKGKWKPIIAYYSCYYAFYALLMKVGIKCEIHDRTIELMSLFDFSHDQIDFMRKLKKERIDVQYYRKDPSEMDEIKIKHFVVHCKQLIPKFNEDVISELREVVKNG